MSSYTPAFIRLFIDDLDAVYWDAISNGTIKEVFARERGNLVSDLSFFFKKKLFLMTLRMK